MGKIRDLVSKLKSFQEPLFNEMVLKVVDENKNIAIDLNTAQLFSGRDSKGESLGEYHNPNYAEFKRSLNSNGVVDLRLTGDFYSGFFALTDNFPITFSSNDSKYESLELKYGKDIFGLDQESLEQFRNEIKEQLQEEFRKILFL